MAINETISTGNKYRRLKDATNKVWQRLSFWTKASDVEFDNGNTAEASLGSITGITDSLASTSSNVAASAKAVNTLNTTISSFQAGVNTLYNKCVSLGVTPAGKTLTDITNALQSVYNAGITAADNRANTGSVNYKTGYNNGYSAGVTAADARANANSTNYKTGYNAGYSAGSSAGYSSGYSAGQAAATVKLQYYTWYVAWYMSNEAARVELSLAKSNGVWVLTPTVYLGTNGSASSWNKNTGANYDPMTTATLS